MKYTKALDTLLRQRIALQHQLDAHHCDHLTALRSMRDLRIELRQLDAAIASHVEGATP